MADERDEFLIGFIGCWPTQSADGLIGAAMVTNERGYPREFRVTTAVRPTGIQKALYGDSLERYLVVELIGQKLVSDSRLPLFALTNRREMLDVPSPFPLMFAAPADQMVVTDRSTAAYQRLEVGGAAIGLLARDAEQLAGMMDRLRVATRYFDPLGAFDRMRTALNVLGESDARYR